MESLSFEICAVCNKTMIDPRLLPCAHSFCLKCLESSTVSKDPSRCPTCQIEIQIPEGGLKDLKKNEFIEQLNNLKQSNVICDWCNKNEAINFCVDCSFNYCSTCLVPHGRIPSTSNHQLQPVFSTKELADLNSYSTCTEHLEMMTIFCKDCNAALCSRCFALEHIAHKVEHIKEYFDSVFENMKESLKTKEEITNDVRSSFKNCEDVMRNIELKASELKKEIQQRSEIVKRDVDSIVDKLIQNVDEEVDRQRKQAAAVMEELKIMESVLNAQIKTFKEKLNDLNYKNMFETYFPVENNIKIIPKYFGDFDVSLHCNDTKRIVNLEKMIGTLSKASKFKSVKENKFDFAAKCIASNQGDIFLCSTEGGVHFVRQLNNFDLKTKFYFGNDLPEFIDALIVNNVLYVLDQRHDIIRIIKFDVMTKNKPREFFKYRYKGTNFKLSKCINGKIILSLSNKLLHLSQTGNVTKIICFFFHVRDVLEIDQGRYVVCTEDKVCIVNDCGEEIVKYSPPDESQAIKIPRRLAKDIRSIIYVFDGNPKNHKIIALDHKLNFISSHDINRSVHKMCYDEANDKLFMLTNDNYLTTIEL